MIQCNYLLCQGIDGLNEWTFELIATVAGLAQIAPAMAATPGEGNDMINCHSNPSQRWAAAITTGIGGFDCQRAAQCR